MEIKYKQANKTMFFFFSKPKPKKCIASSVEKMNTNDRL